MKKRARLLLAAILIGGSLILMIVSLSPIDRVKLGTQPHGHLDEVSAHRNHRVAHWLSFGSLACLLALLTPGIRLRVLGLTGVVAFGALIEYLQSLIYSHAIETWDVRDDACGAFAGFVSAVVILAIRRRAKRPSLRIGGI
jgi:VanZ family protein